MTYHIVTLFPKIYQGFLESSLIYKAQRNGLLNFKIYDLREFGLGKRKITDTKPFGGGPGMILRIEPVVNCVNKIRENIKQGSKIESLIFSATGQKYDQNMAKKLAGQDDLILICPRYEGFDARITQATGSRELSIGNYILMGGDIAALTVIESSSRLILGVLGKTKSLIDESFSKKGYLEYPQYTKPQVYKEMRVPHTIISGNHKEIELWKKNNSKTLV